MKKFRFSLEAALHLRELRLESEEAKLSAIHAELDAVRHAEQTLRDELEESSRAVLAAEPDAFLLGEQDRFRQAAGRRFAAFANQAALIGQRIAEQKQKVVIARRDRELLVKLKEAARNEWLRKADRELQAVADEAYLSRWGR
ncbi:MAG: hypothetical protein FJW30_10520 [Acidobacteria bacterium]|nr:hypothetical protein [Acidobacteriota bacterium]